MTGAEVIGNRQIWNCKNVDDYDDEDDADDDDDDDDDGDDDLSGFLLGLATSRAALDGSWVLDFHHW